MTDLPKRLKQAREAAGFETATAAAERFKWKGSSYRSAENGYRKLSREAAVRYARAFKVNLEWLLTGKGAMYPGVGNHANLIPILHLEPGKTINKQDFSVLLTTAEVLGFAGIPEGEWSADRFAMLMKDDRLSGAPTYIMRGDRLDFENNIAPRPGAVVLASVGDEILAGIFVVAARTPDGKVEQVKLGATAPNYEEPVVSIERIVAVVTGRYHSFPV